MKVDYLSIHFKTLMIPSRTKLESFNSFGSHAQLLQLFMANFHIFFECNEPILSYLFILDKKLKWITTEDYNIRRTLLTQTKNLNI